MNLFIVFGVGIFIFVLFAITFAIVWFKMGKNGTGKSIIDNTIEMPRNNKYLFNPTFHAAYKNNIYNNDNK